MQKINTKSLSFRITLYTALCVLVVGVFSNVYLFTYLNGIITEKADSIDAMYLDTVKLQLDNNFKELYNVALLCANHYDISKAMKYGGLTSQDAKKDCLRAQAVMNDALSAAYVSSYIRKLLVFNENGLIVQASTAKQGSPYDFGEITATKLYENRSTTVVRPEFVLTSSVTPFEPQCLAILFIVNKLSYADGDAYVYMEVSTDAVADVLKPYAAKNHIFSADSIGEAFILPQNGDAEISKQLGEHIANRDDSFMYEQHKYRLDMRGITNTNLKLCGFVDLTEISLGDRDISFTLIIVMLTTICVGVGVILIISHSLTEPVRRLIGRIKKISENDFSYDPTIEQSKDEIGDIGKVVNEMILSVDALIKEQARINTEKKNTEMAMLQAQINPHFLYNTLDSIYWMAVLQKNQGIANITRSLSNLLRNMAKGVQDKVSVRDELALLNDYIVIQSVRYVDSFEFVNNVDEKYYDYYIVKMTLQPIVENAIIHGVCAADKFGTITVDIHDDEKYLYICVTDNGNGMTQEEIEKLMSLNAPASKKGMNGIGFSNANKRLKLAYGKDCGLSVESVKGEYTKVTAKIKKEVSGDV